MANEAFLALCADMDKLLKVANTQQYGRPQQNAAAPMQSMKPLTPLGPTPAQAGTQSAPAVNPAGGVQQQTMPQAPPPNVRRPSVVAQVARQQGGPMAIEANVMDMFNPKQAGVLEDYGIDINQYLPSVNWDEIKSNVGAMADNAGHFVTNHPYKTLGGLAGAGALGGLGYGLHQARKARKRRQEDPVYQALGDYEKYEDKVAFAHYVAKQAATHCNGDPLPKDWNGVVAMPNVKNGGVGSYGEDAWNSIADKRHPKARPLDIRKDWHVTKEGSIAERAARAIKQGQQVMSTPGSYVSPPPEVLPVPRVAQPEIAGSAKGGPAMAPVQQPSTLSEKVEADGYPSPTPPVDWATSKPGMPGVKPKPKPTLYKRPFSSNPAAKPVVKPTPRVTAPKPAPKPVPKPAPKPVPRVTPAAPATASKPLNFPSPVPPKADTLGGYMSGNLVNGVGSLLNGVNGALGLNQAPAKPAPTTKPKFKYKVIKRSAAALFTQRQLELAQSIMERLRTK